MRDQAGVKKKQDAHDVITGTKNQVVNSAMIELLGKKQDDAARAGQNSVSVTDLSGGVFHVQAGNETREVVTDPNAVAASSLLKEVTKAVQNFTDEQEAGELIKKIPHHRDTTEGNLSNVSE